MNILPAVLQIIDEFSGCPLLRKKYILVEDLCGIRERLFIFSYSYRVFSGWTWSWSRSPWSANPWPYAGTSWPTGCRSPWLLGPGVRPFKKCERKFTKYVKKTPNFKLKSSNYSEDLSIVLQKLSDFYRYPK